MKPLPLFPTRPCSPSRLAVILVALRILIVPGLYADAPPTSLAIRYTGADFEGRQTFQLEWPALSNATYLVQSAASLEPESPWNTLDAVVPTTAGTYVFDLVVTDAIGLSSLNQFYRLVLPQPEIFTVEPAVVAPGATVDLYVVGQCFSSNDVLRINGVTQSNVVFNSSTLLTKPTFTPGTPGTYTIQLVVSGQVRSSFTVTCADAFANPELVLQGPPTDPPASPHAKITKSRSNIQNNRMGGWRDQDDDGDGTLDYPPGVSGQKITKSRSNIQNNRMRVDSWASVVEMTQDGGGVSPFSGEVQLGAVDLAIPGRGPDFAWVRTYRSRTGNTVPLEDRWTFSYEVKLQPLGGDFLVHDGTGRQDLFRLQTNGTYTCPEFFREGTLTGGVFRLTFADTGYWEFHPISGSGLAGKLRKIVDRNANTVNLYYDNQFRCDRIVDSLDRTNTIAYDTSGRVSSVTDFSGRTVTYAYYQAGEPGGSPGDLKSVTSPPVTGTPNGNDFPTGKTTTYTYSTGYLDDRENHLLLTVKDALGQIKYEHVYQHNQSDWDFLRCISVQRWTNPPTILTYLPQTAAPSNQFATLRCIVNAPGGEVTECFFDARGRCVRLGEFTGYSTPGVAVTATVNRPTNKRRQEDVDVWWRTWSWNNDSLCTSETSPDGARTQNIYRQDFGQVLPQKKGDLMIVREFPCCNGADTDGDGTQDLTGRVWRYEYDPRFSSNPTARPGKKIYVGNLPFSPDAAAAGWGYIDNPEGFICPSSSDFVTSATDPRGHVTTATYDANGNRVKVRFPWLHSSEETFWARNSHGEVIGVTNAPDANGYHRYDEYSKASGFTVQRIIDAGPGGLRLTNKFERDVRGNMTRFVDARGHDWLYTWNALDQLVRVATPTNLVSRRATTFRYDANDNPVQFSTEVRDANDNFTHHTLGTCEWQDIRLPSRIVTQVSTNQFCTNEFVYNANGQCVLIRGGDAVSGADSHHTVSLQYDERRLLFRETGAAGSTVQTTTQWDYDSNGNPIRVSAGLEGTPSVTTLEYDEFAGFGSSSCVQPRSAPGAVARAASLKSTGGVVAGFGEVEYSLMRAQGPTPLAGAIRTARLAKITDPMGNVTTFHHDANDNLKVVRHFGQMNDVTGTNGNLRLTESHHEYDALDELVRSRDSFFNPATQTPIGDGERTTTYSYAPNGQCLSVTDDLGRTTTFAYDTVGWPSSVTSPGAKTVFACLRDSAGNVTSCAQTDHSDLGGAPQVFAWTNVFDSLGRCVSTTDNVGNNNNRNFDSLSRVVKATDPRGHHSFYEYDLLGRQTLAIRDLDGDGVPELSTDYSERATWSPSNGRLLATMDSHDNVTSYAHDSLDRVTQITHADGTHRSLIWSPRSNLTSEQDANGTVVLHTYDLNNRCISNSYAPGPTVATTTTFETFAYDGCSRLVAATNDVSHSEMEYNSLGNDTGNRRDGWNVIWASDSVGNRTALTYPGGRAVTYAYNALDQCTNVVESGASLVSLEYDGPGRVARVGYGNGMRTRIFYDGLVGVPNASGDFGHGQISRIRHAMTGGSPVVSEVSLAWDRNGNKLKRDDAIFAPAIPRTNFMALTYDNVDRLVDSIVMRNSVLAGFATYGLDRMGNRTNINRPFCAGNYSMDAFAPGPLDFQMNQYTATPCDSRTYDEKGNLVGRGAGPGSFVSYTYDCHNRLVTVTDSGVPVVAYAYNALGWRISKTVFDSGGLPPVTTEFFYDGDSVIEEHENGAVTATYLRLGPQNGGVERTGFGSMRRGGQDYYFHPDDQGNVLALTATGGAVAERNDYDDYGKITFLTSDGVPTSATSSAVGNVYCWGGLRLDSETGLQNNDGGGYFEPQTGRYTIKGYTVNARSDTPIGCDSVNPWSGGGGGSSAAMQKGTVKFFNDAKGFGRFAAGGGGGGGGGGGAYSKKDRASLYEEFKNGDIPDQNDFADTIDSALNLVDDGLISYSAKVPRPVLKEYFQLGDKPTQPQFSTMLDSLIHRLDDRNLLGLRTYDTRSCPAGGHCPGGSRIWPKPGYWSAGKTSGTITMKGQKIMLN